MAVWSDMNGFPEGGFPVLANANDMITLGQVYLEPLKFNQYRIDVLGNNRLAGALVIAGALTGCAGVAVGGALSGVTTIAANNTATLSHATAPLTLSGASAVLNMSGENANILMSGLNSSIGTILQKVKKIFAKTLFLDERPKVGEDEVALVGDLVSKAPLVHTHSYQPEFTFYEHTSFEDGYSITPPKNENIFINIDNEDPANVTFDFNSDSGVYSEIRIKLINLNSGTITLNFGGNLNYNPVTSSGETNPELTSSDLGWSGIFIFNGSYWYCIYRSS